MSGRRFGFECELASGAEAVIFDLHEKGLAGTDSLHSYHCRCGDCAHNDVEEAGGWLFRGQADCTVDGEIISSILTHGTTRTDDAFAGLSETLLRTRAGIGQEAGFHVHVDKRDVDHAARLRLYRMFMRYQESDLAELASARDRAVRGYNSPVSPNLFTDGEREWHIEGFYFYPNETPQPVMRACNGRPITDLSCCNWCRRDAQNGTAARWERAVAELHRRRRELDSVQVVEPFWNDDTFVPVDLGKGAWLNGYGASPGNKTFEFRLWNSTRVEWRMRLAVGISVAMVDAAVAGVKVTKDDSRSLEEVLDPFLSDDTWSGILRQRSFKDAA